MQESERLIKSTCELCYQGCGVLVHMDAGRPTKITGDPDDPVSRGAICVKGSSSLNLLDDPGRLRYPMKRVGARGEGKWEKITWEQAFDEIAANLAKARSDLGPESVAFMRGCAKGYQETYATRFANAFGTPNVSGMSHLCFVCRANAQILTYGNLLLPDYEFPPALVVFWAANLHNTAAGEWKRTQEAVRKGTKLIAIDPWLSESARAAELWVRPRPGTDLALALAMANVIINEELYDRDFVEKWTLGFEKLTEHVQGYTPEKMAEVTWVPAETIRQVARLYAKSKPACLVLGNGIDNNINNLQAARAAAILRAITGNIGSPGSDIEWTPTPLVPKGAAELNAQEAVSQAVRQKRLGAHEGLLPIVFSALPQSIMTAILTGQPYPIKAIFVQGASLLHTLPDSKRTFDALSKLDYLVVADLFMTPTAELADIVLPVTSFLEMDSVHEGEYVQAANVVQKVTQTGECRSDYAIFSGLAKKMGLGRYFDMSEEEMLDHILEPSGMTFQEFKRLGSIPPRREYRRYVRAGFKTPSGKIELYSGRLAEWGFDPMPVYHEPPESPISAPDLAEKYPFVLTNHKLLPFKHSGGRMLEGMRRLHPDPVVHIQTGAAEILGIAEGDWVYIETPRGKIKQRANLAPSIDPRVIIADFGWWFPEKDAATLHGWSESNVNVLTYSEKPWGREMGTPTLRGIVCNVYKAAE
jgi:anaerobic selenocysteine-containing dehydrogenase